MNEYQIHPIALQFPGMLPDEWTELVADIDAKGLLHPIVLYEGMVLDGRHRYLACQELHIEPKFLSYEGNDPIGFCISQNMRRRNLDKGARAVVAARLADLKPGEAGRQKANLPFSENIGVFNGDTPKHHSVTHQVLSPTHAQAAKKLNVSQRSVNSASRLLNEAPELANQVANGHITLHAAEVKIAQAKKEKVPQDDILRDGTGWPIPEEAMPTWNRNWELENLLVPIKKVENFLKGIQAEKDPLFAPINFSAVIAELHRAHADIRSAELYAICPTCHGKRAAECNLCKGRCFISKFFWDACIAIETKNLRQNILDNKKVAL